MEAELVEKLRSYPLLSCLSPQDWGTIGAGRAVERVEPDAFLYWQGDAATCLFVLVDGEVVLQERDHPAVWFGPLTAGELVGTEALASGAVYTHSAMVTRPSRVWVIDGARLRYHLDAAFGSTLKLLAVMAAGLCVTIRDISCRKLHSTPERLASYLAGLARCDEGPALLALPVSKKALAEQLGMEPETLSRAFVRLRRLGVWTEPPHRIAIRDVAALRDFALRGGSDGR